MRIRATAALGLLALALGSCKKQEAAPPAAQQPAAPEQQASQPAPTAAPAAAPPPSIGSTQGQPAPEKQKEALAKDDNLASLPEAEKALDQAVTDLNKLVGGKAPTGGAARLSAGDARCPEACKAMSSLRRAAAAVCRLAGDATDRCARAKGIVKDSEARVAACKCDPDKL
ncbi:MAG: hypothetical protein IT377_21465 [Polyangiaceae bacterium]|nr:hypothetical protein [Polyangiaceae bacterium]